MFSGVVTSKNFFFSKSLNLSDFHLSEFVFEKHYCGELFSVTLRGIKKKSISIWLNWNDETLINRMRKNKKRPIALNLDDNGLKDLINSRSKIYSKANYKINCENMNKIEIVKKITQIYEHI